MDTLFYDGQCSLCAAEISKLNVARGDSLRLVDIHTVTTTSADGPLANGPDMGDPSKDQLLRVLHLRRADGLWLSGADANVAAWEGTSQERLFKVLRWPILRPTVDLVYHWWAKWRYRRLYGKQYKETPYASHKS